MSMKRSKQRNAGPSRSSDDDSPAWAKPAEAEPTWADVETKPEASFVPFVLASRYSKGDLILHPKFGKGLVVAVEATRIDVVFQDGKKKLGHSVT
jgi:hypothetical protein